MELPTKRLSLVCLGISLLAIAPVAACSSGGNQDDEDDMGAGGSDNEGGDGGSGGVGGDTGGSGGGRDEGGAGGGGSGGNAGNAAQAGGAAGSAAGAGGNMGGMTGGTGGMPGGTGGTPVYGNPLEGSPQATKVDGKAGIDSEGPLWIVDGGYLLFSDVSNGKMWKLEPAKPAGSRLSEFSDYKPGTKTNGLALDADGNLLVCERETGKVGKMKLSTKAKSFFAETFNGQPFKAPNDIVVGKNGNVYFSDPIWGSASGSTLSAGAYRVDKQGTVHLITTGASKPGNPNGIALSPDEKTLYVGDDMAGKVWKYAVASDGATSSPMEFASLATPDGIAIDNAGNVYVTSNSNTRAVIVYKPDGMKIGQINLPGRPSNASFGGLDMKTLYMTVAADIYSVQLGVPGIP